MIAGTLEVQMMASLTRLAKDMEDAKRIVGSATSHIERYANAARTALGALGVTLGVGAFVSMVKGSIDAADRLNDLSKTARMSIEMLSGLKFAAQQSGSDLESVVDAINKLGQNIGREPEKFRQLFGGTLPKTNLEAFKRLADLTNNLTDESQRNAVMAAALGKSWQGVASLMSEGSVKIQAMIDRGIALSGMTKEAAERADEFKDRLVELQSSFDKTKMNIARQLLPGLTDIVRAMGQAADEGGIFLSVLVGIGGAMDAIATAWRKFLGLPLTELEAVTADVAKLEKALAGLSSSVSPSVRERYEEQLRVARARLELLRREEQIERERNKPKPIDPAAARRKAEEERAAAERARKFLKRQSEIEAEYKLFIRTLESLEKEIAAVNNETKESLIYYEVTRGSLRSLTPEHKAEVLARARVLDALKADIERRKMVIAGIEAEAAAIDKANAVVRESEHVRRQALDDLRFQRELVGKTAQEQEIMNALRQVDLRLREQVANLPQDEEGNMLPGTAGALERLRAQAEAEKRAVRDGIMERQRAERDWLTGVRLGFEEYLDTVTNAAQQSRDLIVRAFQGMEDALVKFVTTGKLDFKSLANSIISDIIRIQIRASVTEPLARAASMPGSGIMSFLGSLFKAEHGGVMTAEGPLPLRRYQTGGIASGPQLALFGEGSRPEAYVPLPDGRAIPVRVESESGGTPVVVKIEMNVTAFDAKDVTRVMIGQRDTILGIVRQAYNARGRVSPLG